MTPARKEERRAKLNADVTEFISNWSANAWTEQLTVPFPESFRAHVRANVSQVADEFVGPARSQLLLVLPATIWSATGEYALDKLEESVQEFKHVALGQISGTSLQPSVLNDALHGEISKWIEKTKDALRQAIEAAYLAALEALAVSLLPSHHEILKARASLEPMLERAEKVNTDTSNLLQRAALTAEASSFDRAQRTFQKQSWLWLALTALSVGALGLRLFSWIGVKPQVPEPTAAWHTAANLAHFGPRVALVSLLTTLIVVCVQHYRAASHNRVVNLHRATSIVTVDALTKRGQGPVADMLVQILAQSVFAPASTGYDSRDPVVPTAIGDWASQKVGALGRRDTP